MEKASEINERLKQGICKIIVGDIWATAFLYRTGYLMSVGHIFENARAQTEIRVLFLNGEETKACLVYSVYDRKNGRDFSILELKKSQIKAKVLPISLSKYSGGKVATMGAGEVLNNFSSAEGEIVGELSIDKDEYLIKICSEQLGQAGFSGAPIFSLKDNAVIGIQCEATANDLGAEKNTVLAFPLERLKEDNISQLYMKAKSKVKASEYIENYLLPVFGRSLLGLEHSDNLDAYMRCIVVKLLWKEGERFTVFVAKNANNTIVPAIRKHHLTRKLKYGIVGGMIKANVPIIYDFVNEKCYQLDLGGIGRESSIVKKGTRGACEDRIALLVAPIRNCDGETMGVLSFDFFEVQNKEKNIIEIINKSPSELGRILYLSELYAQTIAQLLLNEYVVDVDFLTVQPHREDKGKGDTVT